MHERAAARDLVARAHAVAASHGGRVAAMRVGAGPGASAEVVRLHVEAIAAQLWGRPPVVEVVEEPAAAGDPLHLRLISVGLEG